MITIENVSKVYPNGSQALKNISLNIEKGEFVFIIGSSGSGKSTLIKMLMKELDPTEGNIIINGVNTTTMNRNQIPYLRRNLGIVFQDFRLLPKRGLCNEGYRGFFKTYCKKCSYGFIPCGITEQNEGLS